MGQLSNCVLPALFLALVSAPAFADDKADVLAANQALDRALSTKDTAALDSIWAQDASVSVFHPTSKTPVFGWDAVRKSWVEGPFTRFSELHVSMTDPVIHVFGAAATAVGVEIVTGRRASDGQPIEFSARATNVFEKRNGRWFLIHHHASRVPD